MKSRAAQLLDLGQSVWLDFIRRGSLTSGEFAFCIAATRVIAASYEYGA